MISAIIPAYNEEKSIYATVCALRELSYVKQIIVVDDGSLDETVKEANKAGAEILRKEVNEGKGKAVWDGLQKAKHPILLLADADLKGSAVQMGQLIAPVLQGKADMTVAIFPPPVKKGGIGIVKWLAAAGICYYTGFWPRAPISGQRVLKKDILTQTGTSRGFGLEVALTITCLRKGYKLLEIPVSMNHRETGRDWRSFCHRGRQLREIVAELWSQRRGGSESGL